MRTILRGTERDTLELHGSLPAPERRRLRALVPERLGLDGEDLGGDVHVDVNVLLFAMEGLRLRGAPWPTFDYREALWRIAVTLDGEVGWFAVACDLDSAVIRAFGRRVVRYPTRVARIDGVGAGWTVEAEGGVLATREAGVDGAAASAAPEAVPPRRTFVRDGERLFEIPWEEIAAPVRRLVRVAVTTDTLSERTFGARVAWSGEGLVHRGRIHMCGVARIVK